MQSHESCGCIDRVTAAAVARRKAKEAERQAVDELHASVLAALDAPTCRHSYRELGRASALSQGGLHNVIAGSGRLAEAG